MRSQNVQWTFHLLINIIFLQPHKWHDAIRRMPVGIHLTIESSKPLSAKLTFRVYTHDDAAVNSDLNTRWRALCVKMHENRERSDITHTPRDFFFSASAIFASENVEFPFASYTFNTTCTKHYRGIMHRRIKVPIDKDE